jgi:hypothetical protein
MPVSLHAICVGVGKCVAEAVATEIEMGLIIATRRGTAAIPAWVGTHQPRLRNSPPSTWSVAPAT